MAAKMKKRVLGLVFSNDLSKCVLIKRKTGKFAKIFTGFSVTITKALSEVSNEQLLVDELLLFGQHSTRSMWCYLGEVIDEVNGLETSVYYATMSAKKLEDFTSTKAHELHILPVNIELFKRVGEDHTGWLAGSAIMAALRKSSGAITTLQFNIVNL
jgi:hypothetical protein